MHYAYDLNVLPVNTVLNPLCVPVKLGAGIIRHLSIIFPPGCARLVRVVFTDDVMQLLPTNPEGYYAEDAHAIEVECYIKTEDLGNVYWLVAWNIGTAYAHGVHVLMDVEGVDEPKPLDTIKVLAGTIDNLSHVMRGFF